MILSKNIKVYKVTARIYHLENVSSLRGFSCDFTDSMVFRPGKNMLKRVGAITHVPVPTQAPSELFIFPVG